jgi:hypothetical protein
MVYNGCFISAAQKEIQWLLLLCDSSFLSDSENILDTMNKYLVHVCFIVPQRPKEKKHRCPLATNMKLDDGLMFADYFTRLHQVDFNWFGFPGL